MTAAVAPVPEPCSPPAAAASQTKQVVTDSSHIQTDVSLPNGKHDAPSAAAPADTPADQELATENGHAGNGHAENGHAADHAQDTTAAEQGPVASDTSDSETAEKQVRGSTSLNASAADFVPTMATTSKTTKPHANGRREAHTNGHRGPAAGFQAPGYVEHPTGAMYQGKAASNLLSLSAPELLLDPLSGAGTDGAYWATSEYWNANGWAHGHSRGENGDAYAYGHMDEYADGDAGYDYQGYYDQAWPSSASSAMQHPSFQDAVSASPRLLAASSETKLEHRAGGVLAAVLV